MPPSNGRGAVGTDWLGTAPDSAVVPPSGTVAPAMSATTAAIATARAHRPWRGMCATSWPITARSARLARRPADIRASVSGSSAATTSATAAPGDRNIR